MSKRATISQTIGSGELPKVTLAAIETAFNEAMAPKPKRKRTKRAFIRTRSQTLIDGTLCIYVGLRTTNPLNSGIGTWKTSWGKRKTERGKVMRELAKLERPIAVQHVKFTRFSPGTLDPDGLAAALKSVQDQVFAWLAGDNTPNGKGDDTGKTIKIVYEQHKLPEYGVGVYIR